nr:uncharacterized protein LOC113827052 [Penaeus vannamei]
MAHVVLQSPHTLPLPMLSSSPGLSPAAEDSHIKVVHETITEYPAITVCNLNPFPLKDSVPKGSVWEHLVELEADFDRQILRRPRLQHPLRRRRGSRLLRGPVRLRGLRFLQRHELPRRPQRFDLWR